MALTRQKQKGRRDSGTFAALPHAVMDSEDFRALSGGSMKVLMGLLRQLKAANNGDLSASFGQAREWGVKSKSTLAEALGELQERDLIIRTREGRFTNPGGRCALYALTWRPINECAGKIEVSPTSTPPRKFSTETTKRPVQKAYPERTETVPTEV